jgi:glycosyltransferase involved in cell wall biosynthesis
MSQLEMEKIAVLVPVFNDPDGLRRTLHGLVRQTAPYHLYIVDDGSDTPINVSTELRSKGQVDIIRLNTNGGIAGALNAGIERVLSRPHSYLVRLDAGDVPHCRRLERQAELLDNEPEIGVVGTWVRLVDQRGRALLIRRFPETDRAIRRRHRTGSGFVHSATMIRIDALPPNPVYSQGYPYAEDFDLWLRIQRDWRLHNLPEILLDVEVDPASTSTAQRPTQVRSRLRLLRRELALLSPLSITGYVAAQAAARLPYRASLQLKRCAATIRYGGVACESVS